jgi:hypothetical protein
MTPAAAATGRSIELDRDVAELAGGAVRSNDEMAVGHDRPADACRYGHVQEIVHVAGGPERLLAEGGNVRVPLQVDRQAESGLQAGSDRDVVELRTEIRRADDHAGPRVDGSGR